MKKQIKLKYPLLFFIPVLIVLFGVSNYARALTIAPARIELSGDPGQTLSGEIEIINEESSNKTFFTSFENFEPRGDSGAPYFVGAKDGLATWIKSISSVQIGKGENKLIPYSITIPKNTEPGGYFAAIFFGTTPVNTQSGGEVSIGGRIGALVLLRVNGDIKEGGGLNEFMTNGGQRFFSSLPVSFFYRLNNTGGDRIVPLGEISFKNMIRLTADKISANKKEGSVLPNSIRKFDVIWGESLIPQNGEDTAGFFTIAWKQLQNFRFGWYTAVLNLTWGNTNQTGSASYNFFIIPWQLLILIVVALLLIFMSVKRYNKFIVSSATKKHQ
ncbi:hypothetical protein HY311_01505 [Candidatus Nomurabacteria bacterium]|nr:hypothetical protein [Candidatus Nomurabacteria bacterium]